jgi:uncharacterized RDD family membrane protein YckC|tara:strand:+ start:11282 stop:11764 length:483 start_codon:yes stop_codon:yes gene_type:complete
MTKENHIPSLGKRLAAMGYDSLLVFALLFIASGIYIEISRRLNNISATEVNTGQIVTEIAPAASGPLFTLYLVVIVGLFFSYFWCKAGQTLGMQSWSLKIQNTDGSLISVKQAVIRYGVAIISLCCFGAGYVWVLVDKESKTWHDKASNSETVLLPKQKS